MLALDRPLGVIADLALFGDHADPDRVFYIPVRPSIARVGAEPELSFVKFRRTDVIDDAEVGFLSFTSELSVTEDQLEKATEHLITQGISQPKLVQVPWIGGKAYLAAAMQEGDGFVEKLLGEVTPDLAASNRAVFSMMLGGQGARLVEALLDIEGVSPLGVRYELEYAGLQPALHVKLHADYKRVYEELSWGFEFGVAYQGVGVRAGVESATQKLVEAGAIRVEVTHFTDDADLQSKVDQAIRWFQDKILEEFFESSIQPPAHEDLLQKATAAATALGASTLQDALADNSIASQLSEKLGLSPEALNLLGQGGGGAAGGQGGAAGGQSSFALKLQFTFRDIKQEELRTITLDWSESRAERRTAAPQGLLSRIGPRPKIVEAEDRGDFWDRLLVNVRPLGDFDALGVDRLVVQLAYPDESEPQEQKALVFSPGAMEPERFAAWTDGQPPRYRFRTEVHFRDDSPWPGPPAFISPWRTSQSLELAAHPLSGVPRVEVELLPGTVVFSETPQVQIDMMVEGKQEETFMLTEAQPTATFRHRLEAALSPEPDRPTEENTDESQQPPELQIQARSTWFLADGRREQGPWGPVEGTSLLVHAPWQSRRTLRLFPMLSPDFLEASVNVAFADGTWSASDAVRFEPGVRRSQTVVLPSLSPQPPPALIDVLVIRGDGSTFMDQFETSDPVVLIRDHTGDHRQIRVRLLAGPQLADHQLIAVRVQLLDDQDQEIDSVAFTESDRDPAMLLAPVGEDGMGSVRYRVIRYGLNGQPMVGEIEESTDSQLLVPAVGTPVG